MYIYKWNKNKLKLILELILLDSYKNELTNFQNSILIDIITTKLIGDEN